MSSRNFLDVDDTLRTRNLMLQEKKLDQEFGEEILKQLENLPFILIQPKPGICVKTKTNDGEKVFINICVSTDIPPPKDISEIQLVKVLHDQTSSFSIPMSIGLEKYEEDKGGIPCLTYDVGINSTYLEKCLKREPFMFFTIRVIIEGVAVKHGKAINANYTILRNRKCVGKIQPHKIQRRSTHEPLKKLIKEIPMSEMKSKSKSTLQDNSNTEAVNDYVILREPCKGEAKRLIGLFNIPRRVMSEQLSVFINMDRIVVTVDRTQFTRDVTVPFNIDAKATEAFLDKNMRVLRLNMPVING